MLKKKYFSLKFAQFWHNILGVYIYTSQLELGLRLALAGNVAVVKLPLTSYEIIVKRDV